LDSDNIGVLTFVFNSRKYIANGLAIRYKDSEKQNAAASLSESSSAPALIPKPSAEDSVSIKVFQGDTAIGVSGFEIDRSSSSWSGSYSVSGKDLKDQNLSEVVHTVKDQV